MSATPPLIDSRMYFFSGATACLNVMPLARVTSVNTTGAPPPWNAPIEMATATAHEIPNPLSLIPNP